MPERHAELDAQVKRILQSETFRHAEVLRRLLSFLSEKTISGEADQLKEYGVGIDALGRPDSYDPRQDSSVRNQMARLRAKLAEYYRTEGLNDERIVDIPKGRFVLNCEERKAVHGIAQPLPATPIVDSTRQRWQAPVVLLLCAGLMVAISLTVYLAVRLSGERRSLAAAGLNAELQELWQPFLVSKLPTVVVIEDPLFIQFKGGGLFRWEQVNRWDDALKAPSVAAVRKALNNPEMQPNAYFAPIGETSAAFLLGKLLGPSVHTLSLQRNSQLSWQQVADNNIVYVGAQPFFREHLAGLPVELDFTYRNSGPGVEIVNARPRPGEPLLWTEDRPLSTTAEGQIYAVITRAPGPTGTSEVISLASNLTAGRLAAVQCFTDAAHARALLGKLRKPSGEIPQYYQIVLRIRFKDGVPTETSYVLHHELHMTGRLDAPESASLGN